MNKRSALEVIIQRLFDLQGLLENYSCGSHRKLNKEIEILIKSIIKEINA